MKNVVVLLACLLCASIVKAQLKAGDTPPEISLPNAKDSVVNLSSYKGKVVLIDFWASWCAPCRAANPHVVKLYDKYKGQGFEVFGVALDSKKKDWLKAVAQDKLKYTQVIDKDAWNSKVAERFGVNQIPSSFLLDKQGNIVALDLEGEALENKIKDLL